MGPSLPASARPVPAYESDVLPPQPAPAPVTKVAGPLDMPFRTKEQAVTDCTWRHYWEERRGVVPDLSPLEKILGEASLTGSRVSLANWPLVDETEDLNLGNFSFPISPFNITADDGAQQYLLFSNTQIIANFRQDEYLELVQRKIFDRAVWAMDQGRIGTATVEFDRAVTDQKVRRIVELLTYYGVKTIIWGNELNDPNTPWRDDLPALFDIFTTAAKVKKDQGLKDVDLCLPGLAYYQFGQYLQKMLSTFKDLQRKNFPKDPDNLPIQRVADHYYGSVVDLLPRIQQIRGIMSSEGLAHLKYDLTEVGDPNIDASQPKITDDQLADCFVPQISSLAIGSGMIDRVIFYSLLDASDTYSFMRIENGHLAKKPAYQSLVVMAKLLSNLKSVSLSDEKDRVRFDGTRSDGILVRVIWSKVTGQDIWEDLPKGGRVFDVRGQQLNPEKPNQIALKPQAHPALAGPARIIVGTGRL
ncbi:MAG: hypothetical protein M1370_01895 [Bacteroidetes bacterium]|nr:hypothetical protein [Bacteroidota bacterium]